MRLPRLAIVVFAAAVLWSLTIPAEAGQQQQPDRSWSGQFSGSFASIGDEPVSGQGFEKLRSGGERRLTTTSERFTATEFDGRINLGAWFFGFKAGFGDEDLSTDAPPGDNGDLALMVTPEGFNGRLFPTLPVQEQVRKDYSTYTVELGRQPDYTGIWTTSYSGFVERTTIEYQNLGQYFFGSGARSEPSGVRWEATHELDSILLGGGLGTQFVLFQNTPWPIVLHLDAYMSYGWADYGGAQIVINPFQDQNDRQSIRDERSAWMPGGGAEVGVRILNDLGRGIEPFVRTDIERIFTIEQPGAEELLEGRTNDIGTAPALRFHVGVRARF